MEKNNIPILPNTEISYSGKTISINGAGKFTEEKLILDKYQAAWVVCKLLEFIGK